MIEKLLFLIDTEINEDRDKIVSIKDYYSNMGIDMTTMDINKLKEKGIIKRHKLVQMCQNDFINYDYVSSTSQYINKSKDIEVLLIVLQYMGIRIISNPFKDKDIDFKKIKSMIIKETVMSEVMTYFSLPYNVLDSKTRVREIASARQWILFFLSIILKNNISLAKIGMVFKNHPKNHATVLYAKRTILNLIETDKTFMNDFHELCNNIEEKLTKNHNMNINIKLMCQNDL